MAMLNNQMVNHHGPPPSFMVHPMQARLTALRLRSRAALVPGASRQGARVPEIRPGAPEAARKVEFAVEKWPIYGNLWMICIPISSIFTHEKCWFSIAMWNNQWVNITGTVAVEKNVCWWYNVLVVVKTTKTKIDVKTLVVDGLVKPSTTKIDWKHTKTIN
jgi:hypothetical protein